MQANLSTNAGAGAQASGALPIGNAAATSDMFTKLLVAQIKNQDPLEPTDPSQFVKQLTQLSQTESLQSLASQATTNASLLQSIQALALGAQAVLVGRPVLWGLAVGGQAGVERVLALLAEELSRDMALAGCPDLAHITRDLVTP